MKLHMSVVVATELFICVVFYTVGYDNCGAIYGCYWLLLVKVLSAIRIYYLIAIVGLMDLDICFLSLYLYVVRKWVSHDLTGTNRAYV